MNKDLFTTRELQVLKLLCKGYTNPQIAQCLFVSTHTAKAHVNAILHKLNVKNRTQAAFISGYKGLINNI